MKTEILYNNILMLENYVRTAKILNTEKDVDEQLENAIDEILIIKLKINAKK